MKTQLSRTEIESVTRRGKKDENKVRPIAITLTTLGTKITLLKNKKSLDSTNYYIKEDFPPDVLEKRRALAEELKTLREDGQNAVLKYDRIVILKNRTPIKQTTNRQNNNKRNLSASPETSNASRNKDNVTRKIKKNKTTTNGTLTSYWRTTGPPAESESDLDTQEPVKI